MESLLTLSATCTLCIRVTVCVSKGTARGSQTRVLTALAVARGTGIKKEVITMFSSVQNGCSPVTFLHAHIVQRYSRKNITISFIILLG